MTPGNHSYSSQWKVHFDSKLSYVRGQSVATVVPLGGGVNSNSTDGRQTAHLKQWTISDCCGSVSPPWKSAPPQPWLHYLRYKCHRISAQWKSFVPVGDSQLPAKLAVAANNDAAFALFHAAYGLE